MNALPDVCNSCGNRKQISERWMDRAKGDLVRRANVSEFEKMSTRLLLQKTENSKKSW